MSFLSNLFGGAKTPAPPPPVPTIGGAASESAARALSSRQRASIGPDQTILSGLGNPGSGTSGASVQRKTLLGGG